MMEDARAGNYDVLVVHKSGRFSRKLRLALEYFGKLGKAGVGFVSIENQMDYTTPSGKFMLVMQGGLAELYSDNLSQEVKKGLAERKAQGFHLGPMPFGATTGEDGVAIPDPRNYEGLKLAFKLGAEGHTDRQIAQELNLRDYRTVGTRAGKPFAPTTVKGILTNKFSRGYLKEDTGDWVRGRHESFISEELWSAAQETRKRNRTSTHSKCGTGKRVWSLTGLTHCWECKGRIHAQTIYKGTPRLGCYTRQKGHGCNHKSGGLKVYEDQLVKYLEQGGPVPQGVVHRCDGEVLYDEPEAMFGNFQDYATPDYDDFFDQLREIDPQSSLLENPVILYETARGCWWGEKHHCTFCGLNASTMKFRAKSIKQVHTDLAQLSKKYDSFRFRLVDNILEMKYIDGVFGELAENNYDLHFFIEVKSNLTKKQIKTLAQGGAKVIQPGIESFSLNQLQEMDKGVRPMQNILCMKWAMYYGIEINWNILIGFPGETDDDYRQQIDLIKLLFHLPPPECVGNLWLERFSPYFKRPEEYGIKITAPGERSEEHTSEPPVTH